MLASFPLLGRVYSRSVTPRKCVLKWIYALAGRVPGPYGYYRCSRDWYQAQGSGAGGARLIPLQTGELQVRKPPITIEEEMHWVFQEEMSRQLPDNFVAVLPEGCVWGENGTVLTPDNRLQADVSIEFARQPGQHLIFDQRSLHRPRYLQESVAVLSCAGSDGYFHWLLDALPRLELLFQSGIKVDRYYANTTHSFHVELLSMFGVRIESVVPAERNRSIRAARLIVPSLPSLPGQVPSWVVDCLRRHLLPLSDEKGRRTLRRLYISRSSASRRRIANEPEVIAFLARFGFEVVQFEGLTVRDQIGLMSSAGAIVAPHGAGLSNLVFCQPEVPVIELFAPSYVNPCFWILSQHLRLKYGYLIGLGTRPPRVGYPYAVWEDITVDIPSLKKMLETMELA
jgi:hypothetical protein